MARTKKKTSAKSPAGIHRRSRDGFGASRVFEALEPRRVFAADAFEPNDTGATATDIGTPTSDVVFENMTIHHIEDSDVFRSNVPHAGTIRITVEVSPGMDAAFDIYDSEGNLLEHIDDKLPGWDEEYVGPITPGVYYLDIYDDAFDYAGEGSYSVRVDFPGLSGTRVYDGSSGGGGGGGGGGATFALEAVPGGVVRATSTGNNTHLQAARNTDGDLVVFTGSGTNWSALRLNDYTAAPAVTGDPIIWTDPNDGLAYVAAPSSGGFLLFRRATDGTWNFRDLAAETASSADAPVGTLSYLVTRPKTGSPLVVVAGINAGGEIVAYSQSGASSGSGGANWTLYNISDDLSSQSMTTPAFTQMTSYVTSWNQWTLAGLDASGSVQGVWVNVATFTTWRVDNLSAITGADPMVGELDVTLTTWGGIRFAGANAGGQLVATWWNPSLGGGNWRQTDLTSAVPNSGGPALTGGQLTAWFAPGNLISYAGYDAAGDIVSFYWQPSFGGNWRSDNLTGSLSNRSSRPVGTITSHVSATGETSIVGVSSSHDVVRLWALSGSGAFSLDNLSTLAVRI